MPPPLDLRGPSPPGGDGEGEGEVGAVLTTRDPDAPKIRCPKCKWQPRVSDRWQCVCAHVWNTFDTRGLCPSCRRRWTVTQCLACHAISPHEEWYEERSP